jgi:hypothetical protein
MSLSHVGHQLSTLTWSLEAGTDLTPAGLYTTTVPPSVAQTRPYALTARATTALAGKSSHCTAPFCKKVTRCGCSDRSHYVSASQYRKDGVTIDLPLSEFSASATKCSSSSDLTLILFCIMGSGNLRRLAEIELMFLIPCIAGLSSRTGQVSLGRSPPPNVLVLTCRLGGSYSPIEYFLFSPRCVFSSSNAEGAFWIRSSLDWITFD